MLKLSIIIPIYNVEKYVEKCVRSCAEQDLSLNEYEIIVVNDGSPDKSIDIVERISKEYFNISIVSQENQGLSAARNKGLSLAKGDYVWFIDSDDWIEKNCLEEIVNICFENDLDILHFCAANSIGTEMIRCFDYAGRKNIVKKGKDVLLEGLHSPCAQFSIYRRNYLLKRKLSFYPEIFHEDLEFTPRVWYLAERTMVLDDVVYYVFQNPNSITRSVNPKKAFDLIKVCESLDIFCKKVENKYQLPYYNTISCNINSSLNNCYDMPSEDIQRLNLEWKKHSYLFRNLLLSSKLKYKIEFFFFKTFQSRCWEVYKIFQLFNFRNLPTKRGN